MAKKKLCTHSKINSVVYLYSATVKLSENNNDVIVHGYVSCCTSSALPTLVASTLQINSLRPVLATEVHQCDHKYMHYMADQKHHIITQ